MREFFYLHLQMDLFVSRMSYCHVKALATDKGHMCAGATTKSLEKHVKKKTDKKSINDQRSLQQAGQVSPV